MARTAVHAWRQRQQPVASLNGGRCVAGLAARFTARGRSRFRWRLWRRGKSVLFPGQKREARSKKQEAHRWRSTNQQKGQYAGHSRRRGLLITRMRAAAPTGPDGDCSRAARAEARCDEPVAAVG